MDWNIPYLITLKTLLNEYKEYCRNKPFIVPGVLPGNKEELENALLYHNRIREKLGCSPIELEDLDKYPSNGNSFYTDFKKRS